MSKTIELSYGVIGEQTKWHQSIEGDTERQCCLLAIVALLGKAKLLGDRRAELTMQMVGEAAFAEADKAEAEEAAAKKKRGGA